MGVVTRDRSHPKITLYSAQLFRVVPGSPSASSMPYDHYV